MAETRYLKKRHQTWSFVIKVPADLQERMGRREVVKSLGTRDLTEAQTKRWPLVTEWTGRFEAMRGTRRMTPAEIEHAAHNEFQTFRDSLNETNATADDCRIAASIEADRIDHGDVEDLDFALITARIHAARGRLAALEGRAYQLPEAFGRDGIDPGTFKPVLSKKARKAVPFAETAEKFVEHEQRDGKAKRTEQTRGQYEAVYRLFDSWAGQPDMTTIDTARAATFLDDVAKLDPNWGRSPSTKKRSFKELQQKFGDHPKGLSNRTLNRYVVALDRLWKWAEDQGRRVGSSPWAKLQRPEGDGQETEKLPFTSEEMKLLLSAIPDPKPKEHTYEETMPWLCHIGAFSGMRLNEICGLRRADLKEIDGIWCFDIRRAKTKAGVRRVPVHSHLIALGILTFKDNFKDEWLFPGLEPGGPDKKRGWYISKRFTVLRRNLGVERIDAETGEDKVDFHSFRRSAVAAMENAGVYDTEAALVVGHARQTQTFGGYNKPGLLLQNLRNVVEKIGYEGIEKPKQQPVAA